MKILFITPGKLPVPATSGGAVETLIQILIDNNEKTKKHDITVISIYTEEAEKASKKYKNTKFIFINIDDKLYKISRGIRYIINRIPGIYIGNAYIHRVMKVLRNSNEKFERVIIENQSEYALSLKKKYSNLILHLHNDFLNKNMDMSKKILNNYKNVFCLSRFICDRVREINTEYNGIELLYNGIELEKFYKSDENSLELKKRLDIKNNDFVYLYSGRIVEVKGVRELIEAFNKIDDDNSKLIIVGDINNNSRYVKMLKKISKDNKNIIFTGKIQYELMPDIYNIANVGVIPSIWEEPFALTVIEHLGTGHPVIVSKSGAMPELVNDDCALIVDKDSNYVENLKEALVYMKDKYSKFNSDLIIKKAKEYSSTRYCEKFDDLILK